MTLRYSHLSPAHQLDAVQRLNAEPTGTATATADQPAKATAVAGAKVLDLRTKRVAARRIELRT
jgi:hypothetical protein